MTSLRLVRPAAAALMALAAAQAQAAFLVNGSLENTGGTWSDTTCGYMAVAAGSGAISGWTVGASAAGPIVWGRSTTCDGYVASDGQYFVDLSGFGSNAGPATLDQQLSGLLVGQTYTVELDYQGTAPGLRIDGQLLSGSASGSGPWLHLSASFVAGAGTAQLSVANLVPSARIVFIDDITVSGPAAGGTVPEPAPLALLGAALAAAAWRRRR